MFGLKVNDMGKQHLYECSIFRWPSRYGYHPHHATLLVLSSVAWHCYKTILVIVHSTPPHSSSIVKKHYYSGTW